MDIEELPDAADRKAVAKFALSFNGYEHFGSFQASVDAAMSKRRQTLDDLRNELFVAYRASNHRGDDTFIGVYRELMPLLAARLSLI